MKVLVLYFFFSLFMQCVYVNLSILLLTLHDLSHQVWRKPKRRWMTTTLWWKTFRSMSSILPTILRASTGLSKPSLSTWERSGPPTTLLREPSTSWRLSPEISTLSSSRWVVVDGMCLVVVWVMCVPVWKGSLNLAYYTWAQVFLWFLTQSRPFHVQYCRTTPGRKCEKWMTMAFLLCTNVVAVHTLACCSPAAEGFIPCGHELPRCFVHRELNADSAEIDELERFWALTCEITVR